MRLQAWCLAVSLCCSWNPEPKFLPQSFIWAANHRIRAETGAAAETVPVFVLRLLWWCNGNTAETSSGKVLLVCRGLRWSEGGGGGSSQRLEIPRRGGGGGLETFLHWCNKLQSTRLHNTCSVHLWPHGKCSARQLDQHLKARVSILLFWNYVWWWQLC